MVVGEVVPLHVMGRQQVQHVGLAIIHVRGHVILIVQRHVRDRQQVQHVRLAIIHVREPVILLVRRHVRDLLQVQAALVVPIVALPDVRPLVKVVAKEDAVRDVLGIVTLHVLHHVRKIVHLDVQLAVAVIVLVHVHPHAQVVRACAQGHVSSIVIVLVKGGVTRPAQLIAVILHV